jgi:hypothetical protein
MIGVRRQYRRLRLRSSRCCSKYTYSRLKRLFCEWPLKQSDHALEALRYALHGELDVRLRQTPSCPLLSGSARVW